MTNIVSFDIGIRNLAICIVDNNCNILYWDIINIMESFDNILIANTKYCTILNKSGVNKGSICNKLASFSNDNNYYCNKHKNLNLDLIKIINKKKKNARKIDTQLLCISLIQIMNKIVIEHDILNTCKDVIIELQPRTNQRMKLISHTLYSFFLTKICDYNLLNQDCCKLENVKFIAAKYKLKNNPIISSGKKNYSKRKKLSIDWTKELLKDNIINLERLNSFKKQDDLCDAYLQARWYLKLD